MKSSKYKTTKQFQVQLSPGTVFEIKPNGKYFVILDRGNYQPEGLADLNIALKEFFGETKFLAILAKDLNSIKIAEMMEGGGGNGG